MAGARRVQRVPSQWPVLHLEAEVPAWTRLLVDGLVRHPRSFDLVTLQALGAEQVVMDLHCVWGWSRPGVRWEGTLLRCLLEVVEPQGEWVRVEAASGAYSSCLPLTDAARGVLAWGRDGAPLAPEAGGPLRFVAPPEYWAYKGVKWAARVTVLDRFVAGFWESRVADPMGRIPEEVELP